MNYCITTFGWTTAIQASSDVSDSELIAMAQEKLLKNISDPTAYEGIHLGDVLQTVYTHEPKFNMRITQSIRQDAGCPKDSTQKTWLVSFCQEAAVIVQNGHDEDEYIYEAHKIITTAFPNLQYILGSEDYPVIEEKGTSKTMLVFQR